MTHTNRQFLTILFMSTLLFSGMFFSTTPIVVYAVDPGPSAPPVTDPGPSAPPHRPPVSLLNPLKVDSLEKLLELVLQVVVIFATPIIVFFLIYAGFLFVTAQGNDAQLTKAKTALLWTVIGAVIVIGAKALLTIITNTVETLK